jgi:hypothetical protein
MLNNGGTAPSDTHQAIQAPRKLASPVNHHSPKPSRTERHRLSLSLFKRGSTSENHVSRHKRGSVLNGSIDRDAEAVATRSEDKLHKYFGIPQSQYRHLSPSPDENDVPRNNSIQLSIDFDRPHTQQSGASDDTTGLGSKSGNVKKRFSLLGLGKKGSISKGSIEGARVRNLTEE